jgi:hypothetical protein
MKKWYLVVMILWAAAGMAMPIASSARALVPSEVQQLIGVDYRSLKDSPTAQRLKDQMLPQDLKDFEASLKGVGIDAENDVDQLDFISFRTPKAGIQTICIAAGSFSAKAVLKKMKAKKISPTKYGTANVYSMGGGYEMTFLDDNTMAFGPEASLDSALDTRDGKRASLDSNPTMADQMAEVDGYPVWSILDQQGTQAIMRSALGDAGKLADFDTVKKQMVACRYSMSFQTGINFDLSVVTADSMTAGTLSSLVKAGILFKKMSATPAEKVAFDATTVDSDGKTLLLHFKTDDQKFQALMKSPLFAAVSH